MSLTLPPPPPTGNPAIDAYLVRVWNYVKSNSQQMSDASLVSRGERGTTRNAPMQQRNLYINKTPLVRTPFLCYQHAAATPNATSDWRTRRVYSGLLQFLLSGTPVHPVKTGSGEFSDDTDATIANADIVLTASSTNYIWLKGTTATDGSGMTALVIKTGTSAPTLPTPGANAWPSSFIIPIWQGVLGDDTAKTITSPQQFVSSNLVVWPGWFSFGFDGSGVLVVGGQFHWDGI